MKVRGKYNFFLLHDDGVTKSFRISRRTIRLLIFIAIVLPLVGGGGLWIGWHAWKDRQIWEQEERVLLHEMANLRVQLDRLSHVERLIHLYESGQLPEVSGRTLIEPAPSEPPAPVQTAPASTDTSQGAAGSSASAPAEPARSQGEPADSDKLTIDNGQVRIDAVSARLSKDRKLRVRMDLYNESGRQIAGTLSFFLLTADEERTPLPHSDGAFRISRLKKFASTLSIPDSVGELTNAALMVEVVGTDKTLLFRQLYQIAE